MSTLIEVQGNDKLSILLGKIGLILCMLVGSFKLLNFYKDLRERQKEKGVFAATDYVLDQSMRVYFFVAAFLCVAMEDTNVCG